MKTKKESLFNVCKPNAHCSVISINRTKEDYSMNKTLTKTTLAIAGSLLMTFCLPAPTIAQEPGDDERRARFEERREAMQERRAGFLENNPEAAARMDERRARFEELRETDPEAAARIREQRRERFRDGRPGPRGRGENGRFGPPPGAELSEG